jgi:hypothetical protein
MPNTNPIIIWTFRRTGGTNLGQALFNASPFESVQHEPFNGGRIYGHIIENWRRTKDLETLRSNIVQVLANRPLIKHCLEIMPDELNNILLEESIKQGYNHLFLYRENPTDRLLSLNFAQQTNIWGSKQRKSINIDPSIFDNGIPTERLLTHEKHCRTKIKSIYQKLIEFNQEPLAVSFESLYQSPFYYSSLIVKSLFSELKLNSEILTKDFLKNTLRGGGQGTKDDYTRFRDSNVFIEKANKILPFRLYKTPSISLTIRNDITLLTMDYVMPFVRPNQFVAGGILLGTKPYLSAWLQSEQNQTIPLETGFQSPNIWKKYNTIPWANKCRFITNQLTFDKIYKLMVTDSEHCTIHLADVSLNQTKILQLVQPTEG